MPGLALIPRRAPAGRILLGLARFQPLARGADHRQALLAALPRVPGPPDIV
jgi:hypothetical protein